MQEAATTEDMLANSSNRLPTEAQFMEDKFMTIHSLNNNEDCIFCNLTSNHLSGFDPVFPWNTVLYESQEFVVVPSTGALIQGWLLIISKEHYLSVGSMPYLVRKELEYLADSLCSVLSRHYCKPSIFEHGPSAYGSNVGCGIDHAHLHIAPIDFDLTIALETLSEQLGLQWNSILVKSYEELSLASALKKSYLYYRDWHGISRYCISDAIPSQFFRRAIANHLRMPELYDYKKFFFEKNVTNTILDLQGSIGRYLGEPFIKSWIRATSLEVV